MIELEIIDEAGNVHGPFASRDEAVKAAEDRALGEERRDLDDERAGGWTMQAIRTAR
jgi:hypothetical protein